MARHPILLLISWVFIAAPVHIGEALQPRSPYLTALRFRSSFYRVSWTDRGNSRNYTVFDTSLRQHDGLSRRSKIDIPPFVESNPLAKMQGRLLPLWNKIEPIASNLVPSIPTLQDEDVLPEGWLSARFIVGEMLNGAWYQCRLLPLHMFGAMATNAIQAIFAFLSTGSAVIPLVTPKQSEVTLLLCPFHFISQKICDTAAIPIAAVSRWALSVVGTPTRTHPTSNSFYEQVIDPILVAPISEEIAFRGICQKSARSIFFVRLYGRAIIARHLGTRFAIASEVGTYLFCIFGALAGIANKRPTIGGVWFEHLFPLVGTSLILPSFISFIDFLRRKECSDNWRSERVRPCSLNEAYEWNEEDFYGQFLVPSSRLRIARTVDKYRRSKDKRHFLYYNYQSVADNTAKRYSRWLSSSLFASAHASGGTFCHNKLLGTLTSALLVESRLYANRRNIFAPIGGHMLFNMLALLMPMGSLPNKALYENSKIWPRTIMVYPLYCMATLIIGSGIRWAERKVRGYNTDTESVLVD